MSFLDIPLQPFARRDAKPFLEIVRNFTPNWFTVTMGTGALALTLNQFPLAIPGLRAVAVGLWLANIALFALFSLLYSARWLLFPHEAALIFRHPVMSMFFGAIPMGLATIVNGFLAFGPDFLGTGLAVSLARALWQADAAMSVVCGLAIPYFMFTRQEHSMEKLTAVWLLPIVASEVAAASGGLLAPHLASPEAFLVLILSYVLWACSVPLAMSVLVLLFLRLALHKLPERDMGVSAWLALGPIGTGALGLVVLGAAAPKIFAANGLESVGEVAFGLGVLGGLILWGYGILVAEPRDPQDCALSARGPAVQSRLVGLHLPARGLHPRHVCACARHRAQPVQLRGRSARGLSGDLLGRRGEPHLAGGVDHNTLRRPLSQGRQGSGAV